MLDARRSVWDLRCHLLEEGDLLSALRQTVQPAPPHDVVKVHVSVTGEPFRLPAAIEMNLLRIGQEAVTNAAKHSGASLIQISLKATPGLKELKVTDDGRGFSLPDLNGGAGLGLRAMKYRADVIVKRPDHTIFGACATAALPALIGDLADQLGRRAKA